MHDQLVDNPEIIYSENRKVRCDGGGGILGHPVVFYTIGEDGYVECKYCDRKYIYQPRG